MNVIQLSQIERLVSGEFYVVFGLGLLAAAVWILTTRDRSETRAFGILLLTSGAWIVVSGLIELWVPKSNGPEYGILLGKLGIAVGAAIAPAWLYFCLQYTNQAAAWNRIRGAVVGVGSLVFGFAAVTNDFHWLFWQSYSRVFLGTGSVTMEPGILFWVFMLWTYGLVIAGQGILLWFGLKVDTVHDTHIWILVGSSYLILATNVLGFPGLLDGRTGYTPLGFILAASIVAISQSQFRLLPGIRDSPK